jgi:hypothetical protein
MSLSAGNGTRCSVFALWQTWPSLLMLRWAVQAPKDGHADYQRISLRVM